MNLETLKSELEGLGTIIICDYMNISQDGFLIVLENFSNTIQNSTSLNNIISNKLSPEYPTIINYGISGGTVKIQLSKVN